MANFEPYMWVEGITEEGVRAAIAEAGGVWWAVCVVCNTRSAESASDSLRLRSSLVMGYPSIILGSKR